MRSIYLLFVVLFMSLTACKQESNELPETADELRTLQSSLKGEIRDLEKKLGEVKTKLAEVDPSSVEIRKKVVSTMKLEKANFERFIEIQGQVVADEKAVVSSETGGRLLSVRLNEGSYVRRGQHVATTDLESIDKQKDQLVKQLELANQVFERQERLWNQKIGSEVQFLQAKNNKESLEKAIETLDFEKTKANVKAPISGEVDMVLKEVGEITAPGEPIATIINPSKLKVSVDLPENLIKSVKRRDKVKIKVPAVDYEGTHMVNRLGASIDPVNRTLPVEVNLNKKGNLKPNLLATMHVRDLLLEDVISIPSDLLQQDVNGEYYIYVIGSDEKGKKAKKRIVIPGESYDNSIVITQGLDAGEVILTTGSRSLNENDYIQIQQATK